MLAEEFDNHLQTVMGELSNEIESLDENHEETDFSIGRGGCIILAKTKLMELLVNKMGEYTKTVDSQQNQDIINSISQQYTLFIN